MRRSMATHRLYAPFGTLKKGSADSIAINCILIWIIVEINLINRNLRKSFVLIFQEIMKKGSKKRQKTYGRNTIDWKVRELSVMKFWAAGWVNFNVFKNNCYPSRQHHNHFQNKACNQNSTDDAIFSCWTGTIKKIQYQTFILCTNKN